MVQTTNDNSGMGIVLGIVLAVAVAIGAYYFLKNEGGLPGGATMTTVNIEAPEVSPAAGRDDRADNDSPSSAPAQ